MKEKLLEFKAKTVSCYFNTSLSYLSQITPVERTIIVTDKNLAALYHEQLKHWKCIVIEAGEDYKQQQTADYIIAELIGAGADRETFLVGVGGGVITDITGYVASVYMRGVQFGFVPTSVLAMVDAAVGGKNGVDVGMYKNLVGTVNHPKFLLFDYSLLQSLSMEHWSNGFAEIIKHACIKDKKLFKRLQHENIREYIADLKKMDELVQDNIEIKYEVVSKDEFETGDRKLLNFGHTLAHAIENKYHLLHGHAVAIGMMMACKISEQLTGFSKTEAVQLLLDQYHLPHQLKFDTEEVWDILLKDKKRSSDTMNFILLKDIGKAVIKPIPLIDLKEIITFCNQ